MKAIIHGDADDIIFGVRAIGAAIKADAIQAGFQYGTGPNAPTVYVKLNPSGSWTAWVYRADTIQVVAP